MVPPWKENRRHLSFHPSMIDQANPIAFYSLLIVKEAPNQL